VKGGNLRLPAPKPSSSVRACLVGRTGADAFPGGLTKNLIIFWDDGVPFSFACLEVFSQVGDFPELQKKEEAVSCAMKKRGGVPFSRLSPPSFGGVKG